MTAPANRADQANEPPFFNETVVIPPHAGSPVELDIEIDAAVARGVYSNVALISHSRDEFTLEFAYMQPGNKALVQARVILPISQARALSDALLEQLYRHGQRFPAPGEPTP